MSPLVINGLTVAYTVPVLNETTINITWSTPSHPNGEITGFIVRISTDAITSERYSSFMIDKALYTLIYGGLSKYMSINYYIKIYYHSSEPGVPYYISVVAINQVDEGNSATAVVFTKSDSSTIF